MPRLYDLLQTKKTFKISFREEKRGQREERESEFFFLVH